MGMLFAFAVPGPETLPVWTCPGRGEVGLEDILRPALLSMLIARSSAPGLAGSDFGLVFELLGSESLVMVGD